MSYQKNNILKFNEINTDENIKRFKEGIELETFNDARKSFEKEYIALALKRNNNNVTKTAEAIELSKRQLFNKINEYNLRNN